MTECAPPDALPKHGPLGRSVRLLLGGYFLYEFVDILTDSSPYVEFSGPGATWWFTTAVSLGVLSFAIGIGLGATWALRFLLAVLALGVAMAGVDLLQYGTIWGPPFGLLLYAVDLLGFGFLGLSLILAAILAIPGCEVGAIPSLAAKLSGREATQHT